MSRRASSSGGSKDESDSTLIGRIVGYVLLAFLTLAFIGGAGACYWAYRLYFIEGVPLQDVIEFAGPGLFFFLFSLAWAFSLYRGSKKEAERERLLEKYADEPWKVCPAWRDGRVETAEQDRDQDGSSLFGVLFWNAFSWPLAYFAVTRWVEETAVLWFIVLFPLAGLGLAVREVYSRMRRRKYGTTVMELETVPGVLGRDLTGVVRTRMKAENAPKEGFHVRLTCFRRRRHSGDDDESSHVHLTPLWREEKTLRGRPYTAEAGTQRLEVPVSFALPADQPASTPVKRENRHLWRLDLRADTSGIDYSEKLEVPVFDVEGRSGEDASPEATKTTANRELDLFWKGDDENGESKEDEEVTREPSREERDPYADHEVEQTFTEPVSEGVEMRPAPDEGGMEFFFDKARNKGLIVGLLVVCLAFWGGTWIAFANGKIQGGLFTAVVGAFLGYLVFWQATYTATLTIGNGQISVQRGPFRYYRYGSTETLPASALEAAHVSVDTDSNYTLKLVRSDTDEEVLVAQGLTDKQEADWLAAQIEEAAAQEARFA